MIAKTFVLGLLASVPLAAALEVGATEVGLEKREYTVSQDHMIQNHDLTVLGLARCQGYRRD